MAAITQHNLQTLSNSTYAHSIGGMPHGLGLLTTVASLPPKYRSRYLNLKTKTEIPLDLSRKSVSPQLECEVPVAVNFTEVYTEPCSDTASQGSEEIIDELVKQCQIITDNNNSIIQINETNTLTKVVIAKQQHQQQLRQSEPEPEPQQTTQHHIKPMTPPLTPIKKRKFSETSSDGETDSRENHSKIFKLADNQAKQPLVENTPVKPVKILESPPKTSKNQAPAAGAAMKTNRSNKATRKLKFDEETSSPVSGTIIRPLEDITDGNVQYSNGDIDPKYNIVEITEETKAELAAIKNVIGDYVCKLCRIKFDDAFGLAQHRCACIVLLEYRCPECGKQFNCPANLASHRRWHKPRKDGTTANVPSTVIQNKKENKEQKSGKKSEEAETIYSCQDCGKKFKRQAYLKKHQLTHQQKVTNEEPSVAYRSSAVATQVQPLTVTTTTVIARATATPTAMATATSTINHIVSPPTNPTRQELPSFNTYDDPDETMSDYSSASSSHGYGRLQIIETGLTEEENIAAAALTNLRNCASVIQHTTLAH